MIQGRTRADNSPVGNFVASSRTDYKPQCSGDVSNATFNVHTNHFRYYLYRQLLLILAEFTKLQLISHGKHHLLVLVKFASGL